MTTKDLRIGNIVMNKSQNGAMSLGQMLWKVVSISENGKVVCENQSEKLVFKIDSLEGAPLTEDTLMKMGFSAADYRIGFIGIDIKAGGMTTDFVLTYPKTLGEHQKHFAWEFRAGNIPFIQEVEHIHDIQNLMYTLNKTELTMEV